ncbi:MAG: AmmeMemoRadiSam system protein A [Terriglobia bacterium]
MSPLSKDEQRCLLQLARRSIAARLKDETLDLRAWNAACSFPELLEAGAAFVTLRCGGELRGCIGSVRREQPLYRAVAESAVSAATRDSRFAPVTVGELARLEIEISVLSPFRSITPEELQPGEHGLLVSRGFQRGLLLPQVARERRWSRERFLEETCVKAGLPRNAWQRGAQLEAFTACVFSEAELGEPPATEPR